MGQYYKPTLIGRRGGAHWLKPRDYDQFNKLMEHSYIGNDLVNAVLCEIGLRPTRVAWMGDYADEFYENHEYGAEPYTQKLPQEKFLKYYESVTHPKNERSKIRPKPLHGFHDLEDFDGWFLVNHTQKIYINLSAYILFNKWKESRKDWKTGKVETWYMCIHPLPLLTACGNGRGGGDYYDCHPDYDKVGSWAFDLIEFTNQVPTDCQQVSYHFTEQEEARHA